MYQPFTHSQVPVNTPVETPRRRDNGPNVDRSFLDQSLMYPVTDVAGHVSFTTAPRHNQTMEALGMLSAYGKNKGSTLPSGQFAFASTNLDAQFTNTLVQPLAAPPGVTVFESSLHDKHTVTSRNRSSTPTTSGGLSIRTSQSQRFRPSSAASSRVAAQGNKSVSKVLDRSLHVPNAACCGFRNIVEHKNKPKGLFVTFCQNDLETQLVNAKRDLECCQEQLEADHAKYREDLGSYMYENHHMKEKIDNFDKTMEEMKAAHEKEKKDLKLLKEEYEKRWINECETEAALRRSTEEAEEYARKVRLEEGGRLHDIMELNKQVDTLKNQLKGAENEMERNMRANQVMHDERQIFKNKSEHLELERQDLLDTLKTKNAVISGLEKELGKANDKLSSVAFFREQFSSVGKKSGGGGGGGVGVTPGAKVKDRLYKKYFGRTG